MRITASNRSRHLKTLMCTPRFPLDPPGFRATGKPLRALVRSGALMELPEDAAVLVLLVVTDGARWLPETLRAVRAQSHRPIEILAVENASADGSAELLT